MKITLIRKLHRNSINNPGYNPGLPSGKDNPVFIRDNNSVSYTAFTGLLIDGKHVDIPSESLISLKAGPGPTTVTVELLCSEIEIVDGSDS